MCSSIQNNVLIINSVSRIFCTIWTINTFMLCAGALLLLCTMRSPRSLQSDDIEEKVCSSRFQTVSKDTGSDVNNNVSFCGTNTVCMPIPSFKLAPSCCDQWVKLAMEMNEKYFVFALMIECLFIHRIIMSYLLLFEY